MKVTFIGDGRNDPAEVTLYGHTFPLNKAVDVEVGEAAARKLAGNSHFEVEGVEVDEEREALLKRADELGLKIHPKTKNETIAKKIEAVE